MIRSAAASVLFCLAALPAGSQVTPATRAGDLKYPPLAAMKPLQPERFELSNGMTVFLLEDHELPTVTAAARIRTGGRLDPLDRAGLAQVAGRVMRSGGTKTVTAEMLDSRLDLIGAKVEADVGEGSGIALMYALKENAAEVLHLFADVLQNPAFPQDKVDLAKRDVAGGIVRTSGNMERISTSAVRMLIYGNNSAYAHAPTFNSVKAITRDEVAAFHKRFFQPENVVLGIWGDFDRERMRALINKEMGAWPRGGQPRPELPQVDPTVAAANQGVALVHRPGTANALVSFASLGGRRSDSNYGAALVLVRVLSGRLNSLIRSREGLAYNIFAVWSAQFDYPGIGLVRSDAKRADVPKVVSLTHQQLRAIAENGADEDEIQVAKDFLIKGTAFDFNTVDKIVTRFVDYEYFGYPSNYTENFRENVSKVSKLDVSRVAREFWDPRHMILLVVGDVADFEKSLSEYGPVRLIDVP